MHSERGRSVGLRDDIESRQAEVSLLEASDRQGGDNVPPPVAPTVVSNPFSDPAFMDHIVRAVAAWMAAGASSTASRLWGVVAIV